MKFTPLLVAAAVAAVFATSSASGALVAQFSTANMPSNPSLPLPAYDWADNAAEPTALVGHNGVGVSPTASRLFYSGWDAVANLTKYAGFQISAEPGYQLNLTDLTYRTGSSFSGVTSYMWGYRVDSDRDGIFEQNWVFGKTSLPGDDDYESVQAPGKNWNFDDFSTSGIVEFGLFATAPNAAETVEIRGLTVNGTLMPIPEPSAALLGVAGALVAIARRRRC